MYLKDTCETARAICAGELDADLDYIIQAATQQKKRLLKTSFRKGTKIRVTVGKLAGLEGVVIKINPKTMTVGLGAMTTESYGEGVHKVSFNDYEDGEWNVSHGMVVAV
jgi:hypothetical protein